MNFKERELRSELYERGLKDLIEDFGPATNKRMVEIGCFIGESTTIFAQYFGEVIAVDPFMSGYDPNDSTSHLDFNEVYPEFLRRTSEYPNIKTIRLTSDSAVELLGDEIFDLIYIDGLHTYEQVKKDITNYKPLIKKGGAIAGHDYHPNWKGVIDAVNESFGSPDKVYADSSWIKFL
jgi:ubiquinone/menaquinone biosynthesis C-methylase UbiE